MAEFQPAIIIMFDWILNKFQSLLDCEWTEDKQNMSNNNLCPFLAFVYVNNTYSNLSVWIIVEQLNCWGVAMIHRPYAYRKHSQPHSSTSWA